MKHLFCAIQKRGSIVLLGLALFALTQVARTAVITAQAQSDTPPVTGNPADGRSKSAPVNKQQWTPPETLGSTAVFTGTQPAAERPPQTTDNFLPFNPDGITSPAAPDAALGNWFYVADGLALEEVAYNSRYNEYLVAWAEIGSSGYADLYARVFYSTGQVKYPAYKIGRRGQSYTQIAYNPRANEYLVVWDRGWFNIYAQRLDRKGEPIGSPVQIISSVGTTGGAMELVYAFAPDEYMLLFNIDDGSLWAARGQRINGNGTLDGGYFLIGPFWGGDIVYDSHQSKYLVVAQYGGSGNGSQGWDIKGQFVNTNGTLSGGVFSIETYTEDQAHPRVAWDYTNNQYLVTWMDNYQDNGTPDVYGRRLTSSGAVTGGYIPIATGNGRKYPAEIVYNRNSNGFLVFWDYYPVGGSHTPYARSVRGDGSMPFPSARIWSSAGDFPRAVSSNSTQNIAGMEINDKIWVRFAKTWESVYLPAVFNNFVSQTMPNDPYFTSGALWGLHNAGLDGGVNDADIDAPEAWGLSRGSNSVTIAILDSGIDLDHPEFAGRITAGWDFVNNDSNPDDNQGHGTHVAGTAAARGNNNQGIAGVAWNARIMPVKVIAANGAGSTAWVTQGVDYAVSHNAQVINMSLGSPVYSQALQDAINRAYSQGVLVIASAGNCGDGSYGGNGCSYQDQPSYPGAMNHVLAVASTTYTDAQSSFSTQGSYVDIAAPGSSIISACMGGGYCYKSGTSMAAPHVTGLAALVYSRFPAYSPDQAARAIVHNADNLGAAGWDQQFGCGRINAYQSLQNGSVGSGCAGWGGLAVTETLPPVPAPGEVEYRPGVILVKFTEGTVTTTQSDIFAANGFEELDVIEDLGIHIVGVPVGKELSTIAELEMNPAVLYAEPDFLVYATP